MVITEDLRKILNIGITLTSEKSYSKLLEMILQEAMDITSCDAGTLYICRDNKLHFMIMRNHTMGTYLGGDGEPINMPPVEMTETQVCTYSALHREIINIEDVYNDNSAKFDWQGPKKYDSITGYHTQSILVIPLVNHEDDVLGVLQLINATDFDGAVIKFDSSYEYIVYSLASQASISLSNMMLIRDLKDLMASFVTSMTVAIDSRTPYNANHTVHVAQYCEGLMDYVHRKYLEGKYDFDFTENQKDQLVLAARLHDIGKLITPLEVMNKATRVGDHLPMMEANWKCMEKSIRIRFLEGKISEEKYKQEIEQIEKGKDVVYRANSVGYLQDDLFNEVCELGELCFETEDGVFEKFLSEDQFVALSVRKGTLTQAERSIIEQHVVYTDKILEGIQFGKNYNNVRYYAAAHHEFLNGTGYPKKLTADELPKEIRILTIMDVFESLTSSDRPYKSITPIPKALAILDAMVGEGKLDPLLVKITRDYVEEELGEQMLARINKKKEEE
ncbi:MAG: GAF domain-containing protein [Lachnospiraceae bacterium]|nr:GAF domain-containing protein [Lachnospiraceae bacterium]